MIMIEVYRNLTKKCWSLRDSKTRLVIAHRDSLWLRDCTFKVSEAGRQRVLREKRKNVHAFVKGELILDREFHDRMTNVRYNPYEGPNFTMYDGKQAVGYSLYVYFSEDGKIYV